MPKKGLLIKCHSWHQNGVNWVDWIPQATVAVKHCQRKNPKRKICVYVCVGVCVCYICARPCLLDTLLPCTYVKHFCGFRFVKGVTSVFRIWAPSSCLPPQSKYLVCQCGHVSRCSCLSLCFSRLTPGFPHQCQSNSPALIPAALRCVTGCSVSL